MTLYTYNRTLLGKVEDEYGVYAEPDPALDGVDLVSLEVTPLELETVDNTSVRPFPGSFKQLITARTARIVAQVAMRGFGTAGPAVPTRGLDALLRGCGLARTITAGTDVVYRLINTNYESISLDAHIDGVLHTLTGARGTLTMSGSLRGIPVYRFEFRGLYNAPVDAALVQPNLSAYIDPLPMIFGNTTIESFLGADEGICLTSFEIALGNTLTYRNPVNCREEVVISDREVTGSFEIEATLVATNNIWELVDSVALTSIDLTHGTQAGNRIRLASSVVQAINPSYGDQDNIVTVSGDLRFVPSAANNELTLRVL